MEYRLRVIAHNVSHELGLTTPSIGYRLDESLPPSRYMIELDLVPEIMRDAEPGDLFLKSSAAPALARLQIPHVTMQPKSRYEILAVNAASRPTLNTASVGYLTISQLLEADLLNILRQNAAHFVGIQETRRLLAAMEADYKDLLREVQRVATIQRIADVLKRLLEEGVSIRNMRLILEAIIEWAPREQDTDELSPTTSAPL